MKEDSNHKLKEQFINSFKSISKKKKQDILNRNLEDGLNHYIEAIFEDDTQDDRDLSILVSKTMLIGDFFDVVQEFHSIIKTCGSPIEKTMFSALVILGKHRYDAVQYIHLIHDPDLNMTYYARAGDPLGGQSRLIIETQAQIGEFHVDFLLTLNVDSFSRSKSNVIDFSTGENIMKEKYIELEQKLIIECDGHDFHERTKKQARKDKERDRFLQSTGTPVFRYTGSEIWENVFKCAKEVFEALDKLAESIK
ncbi:endonuclease domain-containing protein [Desulfobacterota bacterium AH_259_B03_O07]|nr:endonuclease domain-containing protein [Desulfobacterota bacterium AH_259_B03_O07]